MTPVAIAECFRRFRDANPQPTTELEYTSTFELLIAVILSAQATDKGVNKATRRLFPVANTPAAILALGEDGLKDYIKTIGLYNTKAVNILKTCQILLDEHGGAVPADRAALEKLPGVGRKTANVILNTAFRQPVMAVDTHIFRVANRTGIAPGKTVLAVEKGLMAAPASSPISATTRNLKHTRGESARPRYKSGTNWHNYCFHLLVTK